MIGEAFVQEVKTALAAEGVVVGDVEFMRWLKNAVADKLEPDHVACAVQWLSVCSDLAFLMR
jgi:hypothetical protein